MTKRASGNTCSDFVDKKLGTRKSLKKDPKDSPSNTSDVLNNGKSSPSTVNRKTSSNPKAALVAPGRNLPFEDDPETGLISGMVTKNRLKALCSMEEPTVNVGIGMVGAAQLLKLTSPSSWSDEVELAMEEAMEAAKVLFRAEHLRNNGMQLLFKSQKLV